jgi:hypothetical protein
MATATIKQLLGFSASTKATTEYAIATLVEAFGDTPIDALTTRFR